MSLPATVMVHTRLNPVLKQQATEVLESMGLSLSEAFRIFLTKVVSEQRIPFELSSPNAKTIAAMKEAEELLAIKKARFQNADEVFNAIEKECQ